MLHVKPGPGLQVSNEFKTWRVQPSLAKNAAPHSGTVAWVRGLRDRITGGHCSYSHDSSSAEHLFL